MTTYVRSYIYTYRDNFVSIIKKIQS